MDAIVAARVPVEVKERGNSVLEGIGKTPTQLINSAYGYVLAYGNLPFDGGENAHVLAIGTRQLTSEQQTRIDDQMKRLRVSDYDYSQDTTKTLKQTLVDKKKADYAALA
jgi:antitoxin component of RelBE/YafQ-DinJ toxin-antitoxin module